MSIWIGSAIVSLLLALSLSSMAMAQADDDTFGSEPAPVDAAVTAPAVDQASVTPGLFLRLTDPLDEDLEVPLGTDRLAIVGVSLPNAVVSVDADLVDVDDQGNFSTSVALDEGANAIEVVASDDQGNQVSTTVYVVRGE